ncbi:transposase family protein [Streptomyces violaceusniger]|uniref:transposase family protein n=1 Tax=Streptomyces violaceusniger TaxID=68280 RepID=UPI003826B4EF
MLVDGTDVPTGNRAGHDVNYNGKRRRAGLNIQISADVKGGLLGISVPLRGSIHDRKAFTECGWESRLADTAVIADPTYQGTHAVELAVQPQVWLVRGKIFDRGPEMARKVPGEIIQCRIVQLGLAPVQVGDEQLPDAGVPDLVAVDHLLDRQPSRQQRSFQRRGPVRGEVPHLMEHLPGKVSREPASGTALAEHQPLAAALARVVQKRRRRQVSQRDALGGEGHRDVEQRDPVVDRVHRFVMDIDPEFVEQRVVLGGQEALAVVQERVRAKSFKGRLDDPQAEQAGGAHSDLALLLACRLQTGDRAPELVEAAGLPPLLPALAGEAFQMPEEVPGAAASAPTIVR